MMRSFALTLAAFVFGVASVSVGDVVSEKAAFEASRPKPVESVRLSFEGVDGYDVYNCSVPFDRDGRRFIFGRVERHREWATSMTALFEEVGKDRYRLVPGFKWLELEDPYVQAIGGKPVVGGTFVTKVNFRISDFRSRFYMGEFDHLYSFATGPSMMKDIRLVELANGRIGVFTRPRGEEIRKKYGSESVVGYYEIADFSELTPERIAAAEPIEGLFGKDEWGGCNQAYLLPGGRIGVAAHLSALGTEAANGQRRQIYCNAAFVFDPVTRTATKPKIIATRDMYPSTPAKVPHLDDCAFTSGFVFNDDGSCDVYSGLSDSGEGRVRIRDGKSVFGQIPVKRKLSFPSNADWMRGRLGAFAHYLLTPNDLALADAFDVDGLIAQLERMNVAWFGFTLGQFGGAFCSPNDTYERLQGKSLRSVTTKRDLPKEIATALKAKGIRFMLYLPCQPSPRDPIDGFVGPPDLGNNRRFTRAGVERWARVIEEWSRRYGDLVDAWWFDGGYQCCGFSDEFAAIYAKAAKSGNPHVRVTFNPGVSVTPWCASEDYLAGENDTPMQIVCRGPTMGGKQWHTLTHLGREFMKPDIRWPDIDWVDWLGKTLQAGGAVTIDLFMSRANGRLQPEQVEQFVRVRSALDDPSLRERMVAAAPGFWNREQLYATPGSARIPERDDGAVKAVWIDGEPYRGHGTRCFAYFGIPEGADAAHPAPAMVLIHGGLGTAYKDWVRMWLSRGYAAIAVDTCGAVPVSMKDVGFLRHVHSGPSGWGGFYDTEKPISDQWFYHAVTAVVRSHSFLRTQPGVDPTRIGLTGVSWGGVLACAVAAVDERFRFAVPVYGCGFLDRNSAVKRDLQIQTEARSLNWMRYWDPSAYLKRVKCPFLWVDGTNDFAFPLDILKSSVELVRDSAKAVRIEMKHGHGGPGENPPEILAFANHYLRGGADVVRIVRQEVSKGKMNLAYRSNGRKVDRVEFVWTTSADPCWARRKFQSRQVEALDREGETACAEIPKDATVFFMNVVTDDGLVSSSSWEIR